MITNCIDLLVQHYSPFAFLKMLQIGVLASDSKCRFAYCRVASTGQTSKRSVQSIKHSSSFNSSNTKANKMDSSAVDPFRRCKSVTTEGVDTSDIDSHHILELPSLLEPKGKCLSVGIINRIIYDTKQGVCPSCSDLESCYHDKMLEIL